MYHVTRNRTSLTALGRLLAHRTFLTFLAFAIRRTIAMFFPVPIAVSIVTSSASVIVLWIKQQYGLPLKRPDQSSYITHINVPLARVMVRGTVTIGRFSRRRITVPSGTIPAGHQLRVVVTASATHVVTRGAAAAYTAARRGRRLEHLDAGGVPLEGHVLVVCCLH